jgi:propionyl-CoA carboxylase alpha chain
MRIMRTIRKMGIRSVAVFSEADRHSPHVRFADEAVCLGAPPSNQSYLNGDKIIAICKELGVDGIHPGYGFLSENAEFAQKV